MRHRLHKFMDKIQEKPVEERQKILVVGTVVTGILVAGLGLWNISSNLVAFNDFGNTVTENSQKDSNFSSVMSKLQTDAASVWGSMQSSLKNLNDQLGERPVQPSVETQESSVEQNPNAND